MRMPFEPTQPITHPKTTIIVATEDDFNSAWAYDPTAFGRKMLTNMGWKEGDGLKNYLQGMTNNLIAYYRSDNLGMGATTDLHSDSGWSKMNKIFGGVFEALRRDHQGSKTGTGRT